MVAMLSLIHSLQQLQLQHKAYKCIRLKLKLTKKMKFYPLDANENLEITLPKASNSCNWARV